MALYYPGCATTIPNPQCSDCPTRELSDVRSIFLVKNDFSFVDITDVTEWTTGITNEDIYVFPYTKGTVTIEPNMVPGFGDQEEYLDGYTYTLEAQEPNYKGNFAFWNAMKNQRVWKIGYRTETQVHLSDVTASIIPSAPVAEGKKTAIVWNIMAKWNQDDLMEPFDMPTGVFEQCIDVV